MLLISLTRYELLNPVKAEYQLIHIYYIVLTECSVCFMVISVNLAYPMGFYFNST